MMQQSATNGVPPPMPPQQYQPPQQWGQQPPPPQVYHPQAAQHPVPPPMWNQQPPPQVYQPQVAAPPPHPQPQPSPAQYGAVPQQQQPASADEIRTLWIGDLQFWVDENYINSCFAHSGEVISVKVIRNKQTSQSEGYGFIEFATRAAAERVLQTYNGTLMPNTDQNFRLNWATLGSGEKRDDSADHTIFVGDLAADVTDYLLQETFRTNYPSVKGAKVVTDRTTGRSKGYGFVKFGDESEQLRAMTEMNGQFCSTRQMRIGPATSKNKMTGQQQYPKGCRESLIYGPGTDFS